MKRSLAVLAFLLALGTLFKLATKPAGPADSAAQGPPAASRSVTSDRPDVVLDPKTQLLSKYEAGSPEVREMVARVAERFGRNWPGAIERTDGLNGLILLDRLDLEAFFLYEKHPADFRRLRMLGADAAADLLLHWREYFGLKRADETDARS